MGGFKFDIGQPTKSSQMHLDVISSNHFLQLITSPRRITESSSSLLDHVITIIPENRIDSSGTIQSPLTDHYPVFIDIKSNIASMPHVQYQIFKTMAKKDEFCVTTLEKLNNTDMNISSLNGILHNSIDHFVPLMTFLHKNPNKICPWINNNNKNFISKRDRARKQPKRNLHSENR